MMKILIGTPTASGIVKAAYARSLVHATLAITQAGGSYRLGMIDGSDVVVARNCIVAEFLQNPEFTHLLFIDSDMDIGRSTFERLLTANRDIAGAIYPKRQRDETKYAAYLAQGMSQSRAAAASSDFVVQFSERQITVDHGWCQVAGIGAGCLMIKRQVFDALVASNQIPRIPDQSGRTDFVFNFFGCKPKKDGTQLSEDFSFCLRCTDAGFRIWAMVDAEIGHVGEYRYQASFKSRLELMASRS